MEDKNVGIIGTGLIGKKTVQKISGLCKKVIQLKVRLFSK